MTIPKCNAIDNTQADVLLLEDNPIEKKAFHLIFDACGLTVYIATTTQEAIAQFQPGKYQMVLLDIRPSDSMDGYAVSRHIREMEKGTSFHAPIIGISAPRLEGQAPLAYADMDEMCVKPLLFDQAKVLLERYAIFAQPSS